MEIKYLNIEKIKPYNKNAKKHDAEQIERVAKSIDKFGFLQPIVIDKNNEIVIGHCRFEASKKLGMKDVPCLRAEDLTDEQIKALRIVDNKVNESEWDYDALYSEFEKAPSFDFEEFGFLPSISEEEYLEEDEEETAEVVLPPSNKTYRKIFIMHSPEEEDWFKSKLGLPIDKELEDSYKISNLMKRG